MSEQINFNTIYTVLCLIFSCGTAYATIKISIKSIVTDMEHMKRRMDTYESETKRRLEAHETEMAAWRTEREVSRVRFEQLQKEMSEVSSNLKGLTETIHKLEKRGDLRWREDVRNGST